MRGDLRLHGGVLGPDGESGQRGRQGEEEHQRDEADPLQPLAIAVGALLGGPRLLGAELKPRAQPGFGGPSLCVPRVPVEDRRGEHVMKDLVGGVGHRLSRRWRDGAQDSDITAGELREHRGDVRFGSCT